MKHFPCVSLENPCGNVIKKGLIPPPPTPLTSVKPRLKTDYCNCADTSDFPRMIRKLWACLWIPCAITWSVLSSRMRWMALQGKWSTYPCSHCTRETSSIQLPNPLQTCPISHSIFCINLFLPYTRACTFLEMTSLSGQRCCFCSPMFTVKRATHTFTSCDEFYHTLI